MYMCGVRVPVSGLKLHGCQLNTHVAVALVFAGVPLSFAEVQEAVRLTRQTAIGYIRGSKAPREKQRRQAVLGCSASHRVTFEEADRIVVIALVSSLH